MIGVSKIFRAIAMKRVTDAFGDAPFSEAFKIQSGIKHQNMILSKRFILRL
jgi:hypothetical protein